MSLPISVSATGRATLAALLATCMVMPRLGTAQQPARREVTATRTTSAIKVDGLLDESVWKSSRPAADFVQSEPLTGKPATEATEVWVAFDDDNLYIAANMHDSHPKSLLVTDIKKDFKEEDQDDFELLLDTFGDRRNGYVFSTNVEGARHDRQVALEGRSQPELGRGVGGADASLRRRMDGRNAHSVSRAALRQIGSDAVGDQLFAACASQE